MKSKKNHIIISALVIGLALLLLTPGYYGNAWRASGKKWFVDWQKFNEHLVVARLVQSRQAGIFSYGGLLGFGDITTWNVNSAVIEHEYDLYANGGEFTAYWTYNSVPGSQAVFFSLLENHSGLAPSTNLKLFRLVEAFLTAGVLGFFLAWVGMEFGIPAALAALIFMAISEWMTLFGANFYWNLWSFYLPLVVLCFFLRDSSMSGRDRLGWLFISMALSLFVKGLFSGFEFISTALVMPFSGMVYYALRDKWIARRFASRFFIATAGMLTGTVAVLGILSLQIAAVSGGWGQSIGYILHTFGKRTLGDPAQFNGLEAESLRANLLPVLAGYFNGRAINLNSVLQVNLPALEISYWQIFSLFAVFTLFFVYIVRFRGGFTDPLRTRALVLTTWFSALAPLSWFVLFKAHSYIHTQLNFIIWQMPFTILGVVMCAYVLSNLFHRRGDLVEST